MILLKLSEDLVSITIHSTAVDNIVIDNIAVKKKANSNKQY